MKKYIVTHSSGSSSFTYAYIIAGHCDRSLGAYLELIKEAKKDFDFANNEVQLLRVMSSTWCMGCAVICLPLPEKVSKEGWININGFIPYVWFG